MNPDTLTTVRTFLRLADAQVARTALEAAGIDAIIRHDDWGGLGPQLARAGIELLVREEDAANAAELLDTAARVVPETLETGKPPASPNGERS